MTISQFQTICGLASARFFAEMEAEWENTIGVVREQLELLTFWSFFRGFVLGDPTKQVDIALAFFRISDAVVEFANEWPYAAARAVAPIAADIITELELPPQWKQRVFRADEAVAWLISLVFQSTIALADADMPAEWTAAKAVGRAGRIYDVVTATDDTSQWGKLWTAWRASFVARAQVVAVSVGKGIVIITMLSVIAVFVQSLKGQPGLDVLGQRALPQDSQIVGGRRRNRGAGRDA